jgi:hypothetical protein
MTINQEDNFDPNQKKSFAERFAKKPPVNSTQQLSSAGSSNNQKISNIDPKKRAMADLIYLVHGNDRGREAWYYVLVDRLKVQIFLKAMKTDMINLDDYGKVLYSAYGENPPESVTAKLKEEYGIDL